jgi:hypothetical protein
MPMFRCDRCGVRENTALTEGYWLTPPGQKLCSECYDGQWHGRFPKVYQPMTEEKDE